MMTFEEAFEDLVKDMYSAETQVLEALPKAAEAAENEQLRAAFEKHRMETQEHVARLKKIAETCDFQPTGKECKAAKGLIEEMDEIIEEGEEGAVRDAMLICGAQKFEHYEIANYGTALTWANMLGKRDCVMLLQETLEEEEMTDENLTAIAESVVNPEAEAVSEEGRASLQ